MFYHLPNDVINIILLQLESKDLINANFVSKLFYGLMDENFWKNKYEQDYLKVDIEKMSWKELYFRMTNVNQNCPKYHFGLGGVDVLYYALGEIPILKSERAKDVVSALTFPIMDSVCMKLVRKNKDIVLCNKIHHQVTQKQSSFEQDLKTYIKNNMEQFITNLEIGDVLILYYNYHSYWGQTLTKYKDYYEVTFDESK